MAKIKESGLIDKLSEQWWRFERRAQEGRCENLHSELNAEDT